MGRRTQGRSTARSSSLSPRWVYPTVAGMFLLTGTGLVTMFATHDGKESDVTRQPGVTLSSADARFVAEAKAFYDQARLSLSPLLAHVQRLKTTLRLALEEQEAPSPSLAGVVTPWAEDIATARDLVGRLIPPGRPESISARDLYAAGAMLYLESVRTLSHIPRLGNPGLRHETARSGLRVYDLADRVFDQAKRVLNLHGDLQLGEQTLPAPVPDFVGENLQPGASGPVRPEGAGFAGDDDPQLPVQDWVARFTPVLARAMADLREAAGEAYGAAPASTATLEDLAGRLDSASAELATAVPAVPAGREGVVALRLALLVESESVRSAASPDSDGGSVIARRLRLIGERLWGVGSGLLSGAGVSLPAGGIGDAGLDASLLGEGGLFKGNPPALRPGDPVDKDVPGGLRVPDPNKTLNG
jgi:hypothetical protein